MAASDIDVVVFDKHPFFADHRRKLVVVQNDGAVEQQELYADAGSGCSAFLYDTESQFIVIDCNGTWYSVSKTGGDIGVKDWKWQEKPPDDFIGKFTLDDSFEYRLTEPDEAVDTDEIYKNKDPWTKTRSGE